jgi:hypothetical protein
VEEFIHRENLIIFKRRLAGAKNDAQRQMLLKLLAGEEAKSGPLTAARSRSKLDHQVGIEKLPPGVFALTKRSLEK